MKLKQLRSKEINQELERFNISLNKKDSVQLREDGIILVNKKPQFFYHEHKIVPTLHFLQEKMVLPTITVDMGAIKHVINGADIMRPGITEISEGIKTDSFIMIIDQNNHKPLAVGIALLGTEDMKSATTGKVVRNIHYVGDWIWKI